MPKILIVDDNPSVRLALETLFEVHGMEAVSADGADEALRRVATDDIGAVVQDMNFTQNQTSGDEGVSLFRAIRTMDPELPVLLMTAWTSLETAVTLVKEGAADYMAKPWNDDKLVATVRNLVSLRGLRDENLRLRSRDERGRRELAKQADLRGIVYASREMQELVRLAVTVAPSDAPVLITGPNGSGKEKIAEIVQANSRRKGQPFVRVNVGALPDNLFEAELFGAEAGAFTGATKLRVGRFESASGGTLFLDELGTLSAPAQAKLLRVLQTGEFERLGSSVTRKADVRVIAATNADLRKAIAAGSFREDLYFRLNVIELPVPPLGDRTDDVPPLAEHFLAHFAAKEGKPGLTFSAASLSALCAYDWPGNVRELQNRVQRAVLVSQDAVLGPAALGFDPSASAVRAPSEPSATPARADDPERLAVEEALAQAGGVVSKAAALLGLSRQAFYRRVERLGLTLERRVK